VDSLRDEGEGRRANGVRRSTSSKTRGMIAWIYITVKVTVPLFYRSNVRRRSGADGRGWREFCGLVRRSRTFGTEGCRTLPVRARLRPQSGFQLDGMQLPGSRKARWPFSTPPLPRTPPNRRRTRRPPPRPRRPCLRQKSARPCPDRAPHR
jgi:hypothetical protein